MNLIRKYGISVAVFLTSLGFGAAGIMKLAGATEPLEAFARFGLPVEFAYFVGACEVAGAVGLYIRPLTPLAAACLALLMLGAVTLHLAYDPLLMALPAAGLLFNSVLIFYARRNEAFWAG